MSSPSVMQMIIFDNNKEVQSVSREINVQNFVGSIQDFQLVANEMLSKVIEDVCQGDVEGTNENVMDQEEESSDEEDLHNPTPKKRKPL